MDSRPFILVDLRTLMDLRFFLEANMFCFLFSRSRRILLLDTSASRITASLKKLGLRLFFFFVISFFLGDTKMWQTTSNVHAYTHGGGYRDAIDRLPINCY